MQCPACRSTMTEHPSATGLRGDLLQCDGCNRLWMKRQGLVGALANVRRSFLPADLRRLRGDCRARQRGAVEEAGASDYYDCPECGEPMQRRSFARVSYIVVHACPRHGMFLDEERLAQLLDFVEHGGELLIREHLNADLLDRMRALEKRQKKGAPVFSFPITSGNLEIALLLDLYD